MNDNCIKFAMLVCCIMVKRIPMTTKLYSSLSFRGLAPISLHLSKQNLDCKRLLGEGVVAFLVPQDFSLFLWLGGSFHYFNKAIKATAFQIPLLYLYLKNTVYYFGLSIIISFIISRNSLIGAVIFSEWEVQRMFSYC